MRYDTSGITSDGTLVPIRASSASSEGGIVGELMVRAIYPSRDEGGSLPAERPGEAPGVGELLLGGARAHGDHHHAPRDLRLHHRRALDGPVDDDGDAPLDAGAGERREP